MNLAAGKDCSAAVVTVVAETGRCLPEGANPDAWLAATLAEVGAEPAALGLRLASRAESRRLNRDYRGQDRPTNVLAFPAPALPGLPREASAALGDLIVCMPVLEAEAREQGKPVLAHCAHLFVHGLLHLLGQRHDRPAEAEAMEQLESRILRRLGFPDPWAGERSVRR